ncbi:hypothetical protein MAM1_0018c01643 [Mucor ambiguus]|uniref:Uncharacterized protein n=1 Tax=Mucor ambiguus TaxID=91626 RepID=A0A0C9MGH3_9FUNG|nr:hypothetical protein MAM1_0018c01643 [Mucor ambiguus]
MANHTQDEYLASVERFDLKQFLSQRCQFLIKGYEHLPPSAVKSLKFKKELPLPVDDFGLLLDYYTVQYSNAQYTLVYQSSMVQRLGFIAFTDTAGVRLPVGEHFAPS